MLTKETHAEITRRNGESLKSLWQESFNQFVEALDSNRAERASELRASLDQMFNNTVDDNTTLMINAFKESGA